MSHRTRGALVAALAALAAVPASASAAITTQDRTQVPDPLALAGELAGTGVTVTNAVHDGALRAAGLFAGAAPSVGFDRGVVLSSGQVADVVGPNSVVEASTMFVLPGDSLLDTLVNGQTLDASRLHIVFVPSASTVRLRYVFGSEEYGEDFEDFVDVFGAFVNGVNCALIPATVDPVTVATVNSAVNPEYFRDNADGHLDTQLDGLTTTLTCEAPVTPGAANSLRLAIADRADYKGDSGVFLEAGSLTSEPEKTVMTARPAAAELLPGASTYRFDLSATLAEQEGGAPVGGKLVTFRSGSTAICSDTTDAQGVASCSGTSRALNTTLALGYDAAFQGDTTYAASGAHAPLVKVGTLSLR